MCFNTIFSRFFSILASENEAKIEVFSLLFRKRRFCENRAPVEAKLLFLRFRALGKPPKIDAEIELDKNLEKHLPKIEILGPSWPPRTSQNRSKIQNTGPGALQKFI